MSTLDDDRLGPRAAFVLPLLTTQQAILIWQLLNDLAEVVWNAHEQGMVEVFAAEAAPEASDYPLPDDVPF